jgi:hypothetical protein
VIPQYHLGLVQDALSNNICRLMAAMCLHCTIALTCDEALVSNGDLRFSRREYDNRLLCGSYGEEKRHCIQKTNDSEAVPTDFNDRTSSMSEYSSKRSTLARLLPHSIPSYVQFLMIGLSNSLQNAFAASPEKITIPRCQQKLLTSKSKVAIKCSSYRYQLGLCRVISCLWNI